MHSLNESLNRIIAAYSAESLREAGNRMISLLANHMDSVQTSQGNVLNWADPVDNILEAKRIADGFIDLSGSNKPAEQISKRFEQIVNEMLQRGHNLHDPRYVGHQVPAPVPLAGLFDAIGSVTNQVMAIYEMGPWSTAVEQAMCGKLAEYLGWKPGSFAGLVTHGGSLANLNGLLVARNVTMPNCWEDGVGTTASEVPPVLVVHSDAHYSIARSAGILGLGTKQVVKADLDSRRRMDSRRLDQTLSELKQKGHPIIAVVACACSTPIGSFDPLNDIADVCEKHSVWMHVDAAHGGSTLLSQQHRGLVAGLERADSLVWDAHKMMFVPALCAFLFFKKHRHSYEAFRQNAPYLFDPSAPGLAEFDVGLRTFECTKRAATYGLWGLWSLFGPGLFEDLVDVTFELGKTLYEKLKQAADFMPLHEPECNIVTFRHIPNELATKSLEEIGEFQRQLRRCVIESGEFYLVATNLEGIGALRVTLINPLTTPDHLELLLEALRRHGRKILLEQKQRISDT